MNCHKVTSYQIRKCLNIVQDNCTETNPWRGKTLETFCKQSHHNVECLMALQGMNAVKVHFTEGYEHPTLVFLCDKVGILWIENSEKWKDRFWGFVTGFTIAISGAIITGLLF